MDPGEVSGPALGPEANEASVDMEVSVGDEGKVLVPLAVEVENYAVSADEARVQAG